jgi:hypothetical protein
MMLPRPTTNIHRFLQAAATVSSPECRLTLPSRGQLPAYGLQLPLMSNVRRLVRRSRKHCKRKRALPAEFRGGYDSCCSSRCPITRRALRTPLAEFECWIERLLTEAFVEAKRFPAKPRGWLGLSVPLRWRPAHGGSCSKGTQHLSPERRKSGTLRASSKRGVPMREEAQAIRKQFSLAQPGSHTVSTVGSPVRQEIPLLFLQPPNPSIEGTASGLRPPAAPHVKR